MRKSLNNIIEKVARVVFGLVGTHSPTVLSSFTADSDAVIVKGIIAMLLKVLSGQQARDIAKAGPFLHRRAGAAPAPLPTRSNGLLAMIRHIKLLAAAQQSK